MFRSLFLPAGPSGIGKPVAARALALPCAAARSAALWLRALPIGALACLVLMSSAEASVERRERWTFSSASGTATLALLQEPEGRPLIMFICGARMQGYAAVIVSAGPEDLSTRRLRMDIEVGSVTAMASAQWSAGTSTAPSSAMATIPVQKMAEMMKANASMLSWRVDISDRFDRPLASAALPSPFGRHRREFLRFCAEG